MPVLAVWTPEDGLLGALAPLGLALAAGSAVVVDLDPLGPTYRGDRSLASLVADGVRKEDLQPRAGVAVVRNGGVDPHRATDVINALVEAHRRVVLRLAPRSHPEGFVHAVVPVRLLLPGGLYPPFTGPAVYQATPSWEAMPAPGIRLPVPATATVRALLAGRRPDRRDRWVRAWQSAWRVAWPQ
jgi:hypothetical protein